MSRREMGSLPCVKPCPRPAAPLTSSFGFTSVLRKGHGFNEQFIPGLPAGQAPVRQGRKPWPGVQFGSLLSDPLTAPCALALYNVFSSQQQLPQEVGYVRRVLSGVFSGRSSRVQHRTTPPPCSQRCSSPLPECQPQSWSTPLP